MMTAEEIRALFAGLTPRSFLSDGQRSAFLRMDVVGSGEA
jgi:hypothetical protein